NGYKSGRKGNYGYFLHAVTIITTIPIIYGRCLYLDPYLIYNNFKQRKLLCLFSCSFVPITFVSIKKKESRHLINEQFFTCLLQNNSLSSYNNKFNFLYSLSSFTKYKDLILYHLLQKTNSLFFLLR